MIGFHLYEQKPLIKKWISKVVFKKKYFVPAGIFVMDTFFNGSATFVCGDFQELL